MDVFGKGTDEPSRPLLSPAVCFICENNPSQEEHRVIDTRREFNPEALTRLSGRKYICEPCATEMGSAMGMVSATDYTAVVDDLRLSELNELQLISELDAERDLKVRVVAAAEVAEAVGEMLREELAKTVKPAAPKKTAPAKVTDDRP